MVRTEDARGRRAVAGAGGAAEEVRDFSVPSLERGMGVLELLAGHREGMGLVEIATAMGVPANSMFRIASALEQMGYLSRDGASKKFTLGRKMLVVGLGAVHERGILECSYDVLRAMRDELKETVALGTLLPEKCLGVILMALDHVHDFGIRMRVGFEFELHCSAPGKAMLAFLPEGERGELLGRMRLARHTRATLTRVADLEAELSRVSAVGYAVDREEYREGSYCVAAAVRDAFGYPVGSVWLTGMTERFPRCGYEGLGARVRCYADQISGRLGAPARPEVGHGRAG
ncbi:MAG: IclR family transcriptional regulator [Verrucomicrobiae bacterium]|nr:IclR family transcriptional regulator [Verrucomicrobiae bacterium]